MGRDIKTEFNCTYRDMEMGWAMKTIPDIVSALRECAPLVGQADVAEEVLTEAADEIERLRAALQKIAGSHIGMGRNQRILVEIAREALDEN